MIADWSRHHHWVERARQHDAYLDVQQRAARLTEMREMVGRHASLAASMGLLAYRRLHGDEPDTENPAHPIHPDEIKPREIPRFVEAAIRGERLAHGLPTDIVKAGLAISRTEVSRIVSQIVALALERMPEDQHEEFLALVAELGERA